MTWVEMAQNNLLAAKRMCKAHPRSAISRAYYAGHAVLANALIAAGYTPSAPYETAPHKQQPLLIGRYLASSGAVLVTDLSQAISRLYKGRLDADYSRLASIDNSHAKEAIRDAVEIFTLLNVQVFS
jgi:uncharacterized protein (UPF0332 family)